MWRRSSLRWVRTLWVPRPKNSTNTCVPKSPNGARLPATTTSDSTEPVDASRPSHGVTSHDVAKVAGVSQATVSRVLRD
ncbi:MAG: LacI family transcriptional regulator, partial [Limnohabitans sp.]|nr:LacI family transcriptional regulator [Limnohabitans sp.]